jgi:hypothetical protein
LGRVWPKFQSSNYEELAQITAYDLQVSCCS